MHGQGAMAIVIFAVTYVGYVPSKAVIRAARAAHDARTAARRAGVDDPSV